MTNFSLEPIFDYEMTPLQAKAYKLGLQWLVLSRKIFPDYKHTKTYPKKGDPRYCSLFEFCFKCVKETQGLIADDEYKLFVKAQLDVLRAIDMGDRHAQIEPNVLVGDKAWVRWKIWKKQYNKIVNKGSSKADVGLDVVADADIVKELNSTKAFLEGYFEGVPKEEQMMMTAKDIARWVHLGKVSGYYAILSPWVKKYCKNIDIDKDLYKITPEVQEYFDKHFNHELL